MGARQQSPVVAAARSARHALRPIFVHGRSRTTGAEARIPQRPRGCAGRGSSLTGSIRELTMWCGQSWPQPPFPGGQSTAPIGAIIGDRMVGELQAVVQQLGGKPIFGTTLRSAAAVRSAIREGFPHATVQEVMHAADLSL